MKFLMPSEFANRLRQRAARILHEALQCADGAIGALQYLVGGGKQVGDAGKIGRQLGRNTAFDGFLQNALAILVAAGKLDIRRSGQALNFKHGACGRENRCIRLYLCKGDGIGRVVAVDCKPAHRADGNTVEAHRRAYRKAIGGARNTHHKLCCRATAAEFRHPVNEAECSGDHDQRENSDYGVVRLGFHASRYSTGCSCLSSGRTTERARLPRK